MNNYRLFILSVILTIIAIFSALSTAKADVYINNLPQDIIIEEGDSLEIPLIFIGGSLTDKPMELYVWKETQTSKEYYDSTGNWQQFFDYADLRPVLSLEQMIEYAYVPWYVTGNTEGWESFTLYVCMDGEFDGLPTAGASCNARSIIIQTPQQTPPQECVGINVSPQSISQTLKRGETKTVQIAVKDSCGNDIDFNVTESLSWVNFTQQTGILTLTFGSLIIPGYYYGTIDITSLSGAKATVPLSINVIAAFTFPFPGGGGSCTSSSVTVWPVNIDANAGETKSATASVVNNCGSAVSYTASVTSGSSWLSTQTSGTGSIQVTAKTTGMSAGTYSGTVRINPSGYSATDLLVTLKIAGQCNPSSAVVNPSTISKSITVGEQLQDINVTVKDNCSNSISYTVTDVSGSWISSPQVGYQNTGSLTLKFNTTSLSTGNYTGTVKLGAGSFGTGQIMINLSVTNTPPPGNDVLLKNFEIKYYSYDPGQVRYFYFHETSDKGQGNNYSLIVSQMDMNQSNGFYNIDMIVKYAGPNCEYGKPTMSDYNAIKQGQIKTGQNNFYFRLSSDAFETVEIYPPNPEGCYYVMVINADTVKEPKISIKYEDTDSSSGQ